MAAKKKNAPKKTTAPSPAPPPKGWQPAFRDDEEMRLFFDEFTEAVAGDIRELAAARRRGEELVMRGLEG